MTYRTAPLSLLAAFALGLSWSLIVPAFSALVSDLSFTLLTTFPFRDTATFVIVHKVFSPIAATTISAVIYGLALAILVRENELPVWTTFLVASALGSLFFWPLEEDSLVERIAFFRHELMAATWLGPFVAGAFELLFLRRILAAKSHALGAP